MFPSKVLWTEGRRVPGSTESHIYSTHTEEPQARQPADCHPIEDYQADSKDCSYSFLLCQPHISDLDMGVSRVL